MNKKTVLLLLTLTLLLTACSSRNSSSNRSFGTQGTGTASTGNLSPALQVAIGTLKLDKTAQEITKDQAAQLLPLWETMQVLESSDTAAEEEKSALVTQIQETMTKEQTQAITEMNLTRQDMFAALQSAGLSSGGAQNGNGNTQRPSTTTGGGGNFGPGGAGFQGPPPDGGFGGGGGFFQGQRTQSNSTNQGSTNRSTTRQITADPNRIPTPLIQAIVEYLKKKAGT